MSYLVDLKNIVKEIDNYLNVQKSDEFSAIELDILKQKTRELYDILTKVNTSAQTVINSSEKEINQQGTEYIEIPSQINLQIEEAQPVVEEPVKPQEVVEQPQVIESTIFKEEPIQEKPIVEQPQSVEQQPQTNVQQTSSQSLSDKFRANANTSLGDTLSRRPISDIRSAITLKEKAEFLNNLFDGDYNKMDQAIVRLNHSANLENALSYIKGNFAQWNEDDEYVQKFMALVYRRFA